MHVVCWSLYSVSKFSRIRDKKTKKQDPTGSLVKKYTNFKKSCSSRQIVFFLEFSFLEFPIFWRFNYSKNGISLVENDFLNFAYFWDCLWKSDMTWYPPSLRDMRSTEWVLELHATASSTPLLLLNAAWIFKISRCWCFWFEWPDFCEFSLLEFNPDILWSECNPRSTVTIIPRNIINTIQVFLGLRGPRCTRSSQLRGFILC